jgi:uncharacterized protein
MSLSNTQYYVTKKPSLFGQGLAFPPRIGPNGCMAWSFGEENVRQCIRILLMTEPGERLMREEYGCGLREFLFEPNTPAIRQLISERISQTIEQWEPRVLVEEVEVTVDPDDERVVQINIVFQLIATQAVERLGMSLQLEG